MIVPLVRHQPAARALSLLLVIGTLLLLEGGAAAQVAGTSPRLPMVEIEAHFVRATPIQVEEAVKGSMGHENMVLSPAQTEQAIASLKAGKAEFFSHSCGVSRSGHRAVIESVSELRYPAKWAASKTEPTKFLPTSFETRDVGVTLAFEPIVESTGAPVINLTLVPEQVKFLGFIDQSSRRAGLEDTHPDVLAELARGALKAGAIWSPIFSTQKVTTRVALHSGETALVGGPQAASPHERHPSSLQLYVFVTARLVPAE